jgi:hypothetical protein
MIRKGDRIYYCDINKVGAINTAVVEDFGIGEGRNQWLTFGVALSATTSNVLIRDCSKEVGLALTFFRGSALLPRPVAWLWRAVHATRRIPPR